MILSSFRKVFITFQINLQKIETRKFKKISNKLGFFLILPECLGNSKKNVKEILEKY